MSNNTKEYRKVKSIIAEFNDLYPKDKIWIIICFLIAVILISISIWMNYSHTEWVKQLSAFFSGTSIAVAFYILSTIGVLTPVERNIRNIDAKITTQIEFQTNQIEFQTKRFENLTKELTDYEMYKRARFEFGFASIVGDLITPISGNEEKSKRDPILNKIDNIETNKSICYMNSLISNDDDYHYAFKEAVLNGVDVRVLLMCPDIKCIPFQDRYHDYYKDFRKSDNIETFLHRYARDKYTLFERMHIDIDLSKKDGEPLGTFQLRYYDYSLNVPMLLIGNKGQVVPEVAYTGFYIGHKSEAMPWIEWGAGYAGAINKFQELFDRKWEQSAPNISPPPDLKMPVAPKPSRQRKPVPRKAARDG